MSSIYILLEGSDDERFFDNILADAFKEKYNKIKTYRYAQEKPQAVKDLIRLLNDTDHDYIMLADFDANDSCFENVKKRIKDKFQPVRDDRIAIVKLEIESWFLAGVDQKRCRELSITYHSNTESVSKEEFNALMRTAKFDSKADFMIALMKEFDVRVAKNQNRSFRHMWDKFVPDPKHVSK